MKDYHRPGYYKEYRRTHLERRREIEEARDYLNEVKRGGLTAVWRLRRK